jgi:uncharacterized membrane protein
MLQPILLAAACLGAQSLAAPGHNTYSIRSIAPLPGDLGGVALGIDEETRVVGTSAGGNGYLWVSGVTSALLGPGGESAGRAEGLGPDGLAVGASGGSSSERAVAWRVALEETPMCWSLGGERLGPLSVAVAVNASGLAVGWVDDFVSPRPAVFGRGSVGTGASLLPLALGHVEGLAYDVDDAGVIVGYSAPFGPAVAMCWWWQGTRWTHLPLEPLVPGTFAVAVAHAGAGTIVGHARGNDGTTHLVAWEDGRPVDLGAPEGQHALACGAASSGVVVGHSFGLDLQRHAIVHPGCAARDVVPIQLDTLLPPGTPWSALREATDINSKGEIVGYGELGGVVHSFVMTPIRRWLEAPAALTAGGQNVLQTSGAAPYATVDFFAALSGGETLLDDCAQSLDLAGGRWLGRATADEAGIATLALYLGADAAGEIVWLQAVDRDAGEVSDVLVRPAL